MISCFANVGPCAAVSCAAQGRSAPLRARRARGARRCVPARRRPGCMSKTIEGRIERRVDIGWGPRTGRTEEVSSWVTCRRVELAARPALSSGDLLREGGHGAQPPLVGRELPAVIALVGYREPERGEATLRAQSTGDGLVSEPLADASETRCRVV